MYIICIFISLIFTKGLYIYIYYTEDMFGSIPENPTLERRNLAEARVHHLCFGRHFPEHGEGQAFHL